jgi:hypothetical protein
LGYAEAGNPAFVTCGLKPQASSLLFKPVAGNRKNEIRMGFPEFPVVRNRYPVPGNPVPGNPGNPNLGP